MPQCSDYGHPPTIYVLPEGMPCPPPPGVVGTIQGLNPLTPSGNLSGSALAQLQGTPLGGLLPTNQQGGLGGGTPSAIQGLVNGLNPFESLKQLIANNAPLLKAWLVLSLGVFVILLGAGMFIAGKVAA